MLEIQFDDLPNTSTLKLERIAAGWRVNGKDRICEMLQCDGAVHLNLQGINYKVRVLKSENGSFLVEIDGIPIPLRMVTERDRLLARMGHAGQSSAQKPELKSPMPGMVLKILVKPGDSVSKGDPLLVLESMKMENVLKAVKNGTISEIAAQEGASVEKNQLLLLYRQ